MWMFFPGNAPRMYAGSIASAATWSRIDAG